MGRGRSSVPVPAWCDHHCFLRPAGLAVPRSDPRGLADGILTLLRLSAEERVSLGQRARNRIVDKFSVSRMVSETMKRFEGM